jgi:hypothetical protein
MRVYVGEVANETFRLWLVEQRTPVSSEEIASVLRELNEHSTLSGLRGDPFDEQARRAAIAHKNDVIARIRAVQEAPAPKLLLRRDFDAGSVHSEDVARAVLTAELGIEPTHVVAHQFAADLVHDGPIDDFRVLGSQVHSWLLEHRDLVEQELFLEPPGPALSIAPPDRPPDGEPPSPATASALVAACEESWAEIQAHHPEVPDAVVVLGTGVERGRLVKLGHWWGGRWIADGEARGEVLIAGEALHLEPDQVFEVLLHEAAHGINAARGIKDTSRGGRYHNQRFAEAAREVLLRVRPMSPYGMADTRLSDAANERYAGTIARLGESMRIARQLERSVVRSGTEQELGGSNGEDRGRSSGANAVAACGCGRRMRMAPTVLAAGPVVCGLCGKGFAVTAQRLNARESKSDDVVDRTFVDRRRAALAADQPSTVAVASADALATQRDRLAAIVDAYEGASAFVAPLAERRQRLDALVGAPSVSPQPTQLQLEGIRSLEDERPSAGEMRALSNWYERFGTLTEQPMPAAARSEAERQERLARAFLKADGSLRGPAVSTGELELMVGDRVLSTSDDGTDHPPCGTPGTITAIDENGRSVHIDFATWGRLQASLEDRLGRMLRYDYTEPCSAPSVDKRIELERIVPGVEP